MPTDLLERLAGSCAALSLGEPLYVAVSGGVDSTVLAAGLRLLGLRPTVVYVHHGLRAAADDEAKVVGALAERLGLPFELIRLRLDPDPAGLSARARAARYAALDALPAGDIALGHQLDDQAETVLDRLARGAGARGLAAMRPRRGRFVRPLLFARRAELVAFAEAAGLPWIEDPSNRTRSRGALRHQVLPALELIRAGAAVGLARSAACLAEDDALLSALADPLFTDDGGLSRERLAAAPAPIQRRALLRLTESARGEGADELGARHLDAALGLDHPGAALILPGGYSLVMDDDTLRCLPPAPSPVEGAVFTWGLWRVEAEAPVLARSPEPGEQLGGQDLAERLRAAGVSRIFRRYHPVIERAGQRWVPGLTPSTTSLGVRVRCERPAGPSVPGGGPFEATI
ncbi:tRNA lysidine(34) synthetase TilS [Myxococcota bacterium]|nr:tRNA lysidine(34) synthetase TilS [Myxococcota bacterium]